MPTGPQDPRAVITRYVEKAYHALDRVSYYQILGVASDAPEPVIRNAYYRLASRLHPDLHGELLAPEMSRMLVTVYSRVVEAYRVLVSGAQREQYDAGLVEGKLRFDADAAAKPRRRRPEDEVTNAGARKFFKLALDALADHDVPSAVMNLKLALSMEPNSEVIKQELDRVESLGRGGRS